MGWVAIRKTGEILREDDPGVGRPVDAGNNGELLVVAQEDFGHKVAVDLINGTIALDYESLGIQNGTIELVNPKIVFWVAEETSRVGEYKHLEQEFVDLRDDQGRKILQDGKYVKVRNDILTDLVFRPIWFTRFIGGEPTKVIGLQTTTPKLQGENNVKCLVSLYSDGTLGISG